MSTQAAHQDSAIAVPDDLAGDGIGGGLSSVAKVLIPCVEDGKGAGNSCGKEGAGAVASAPALNTDLRDNID